MPLGDGLRLAPLAPRQAVEFFRAKGYAVSFDWRDIWQAEHQTAFTVAKAMSADLLRDIRAGIDSAIAKGETFETFRQRLQPLLQDKGWWGRKDVRDPETGETVSAQLGSPRRLRTIYDTNLRMAYKEGQWQRIQDTKQDFPYLLYDGLNSSHPRQSHIPFDGKVLRADDPWWRVHMPCCAWGCKCRTVQLNEPMMTAQGLTLSTAPVTPLREYTNARTGEIQRIPAGVDPEFYYPPLRPRNEAVSKALFDKLEAMDARAAGVMATTVDDNTRRAMRSEYGDWVKRLAADPAAQERRVIGAIPAHALAAASRRGALPGTAMASIWGDAVREAAQLAPEVAANLPALLEKPLAIRLDAAKQQLVYTVPGAGGQVAIAIQLGHRLPGGGKENRVVSVEVADQNALRELELLEGE